ncbi:hypothetical protein VE02_10259 [Pseudogymnoascus sp. 03VT05]|nr:hypothetical protein VE02_10259 [Pseudogymnoascus sp. 03VT05]
MSGNATLPQDEIGGAAEPGTGATESAGPSQTTEPATATANTGPLQITVPGPSTDNTAPPEMTLADLAAADPDTIVPLNAATPRLILGGGLPLPTGNPLAIESTGNNNSSSSAQTNSSKRSATTESNENTNSAKRQRLTHYRGTDELLLQIDAALSTSGGLLAALPLDIPASDPRRQTYIGQLIHFMRTLVGRLHVLDRDYGQALGLLAGEATIPAELKLNIEHPEQIEAPLIAAQHKFIINTTSDTYTKIWGHLRNSARYKAAEVETLKKDVEALVPDGVWANGEKEDVLKMWGKVQAEKDAMAGERKQMELFKSRCRVLEKKNSEMGMELVREKEKLKKRRDGVEEALREEIRKLLNRGKSTPTGANGAEVEGLKKQVNDLQAQLAQAKGESGDYEGELDASRAEVTKLQREIEEWKAQVQVQDGEEEGEEEDGKMEEGEEEDGEEGEKDDEEEGEEGA